MNHYGGVTKHDARDCAEVAKFPRFCPEMRITDLVVALGLVLAREGSVVAQGDSARRFRPRPGARGIGTIGEIPRA